MPIAGLPPAPSYPPPTGTRWTLQRNVLLHSLPIEAGVSTTVGAETTYEVGMNGPIPTISGAVGNDHYALVRLYVAEFQLYLNGVAQGLMAVQWVQPDSYLGTPNDVNSPGTNDYFKCDGGDFIFFVDPAVGSSPTWPLKWRFTLTTTAAPPGGVTLGTSLDAVRGDIWVALAESSRLTSVAPTTPVLDPEQTGVELTWPRQNSRIDRTRHTLGQVGALTWPKMWDGAKNWLLDGYHLTVEPSGVGFQTTVDYYFIRIPGDPALTASPPGSETGIPHTALTDIDNTDDALAVTA